MYFAALMVILLVLVGIFARQLQRAGRVGLAGFLTAFVGTAMLLLEGREHRFSPDFGVGMPLELWELILASLVFSVGYVLLGAAIARAGVLPRGAGILLAVGGPVVAFSPPIEVPAVLIVAHALFGLGLVWSGYALWTGTEREQPPGG
jgi:drug/metabolite transporter (DMT)-like permease